MEIDLDTVGVEFTFDVHMKGTKRVNFYREFYGWKNYSNHGKYLYVKEGVISNMKYIKPTRSTIIVSVRDSKEIRKFFKKKGVDFNEKIVILNDEEAKKLGLRIPGNWRKIYEELKGNKNIRISVDV